MDTCGEHINNKFTTYFTTWSIIKMQQTIMYTPQKNGIVERKNHILNEMGNCMI
jgi:hypothetical protein